MKSELRIRLGEAIAESPMKMKDIAKAAGITPIYLSQLKAGTKTTQKYSLIGKLAEILNKSPDWLMGKDTDTLTPLSTNCREDSNTNLEDMRKRWAEASAVLPSPTIESDAIWRDLRKLLKSLSDLCLDELYEKGSDLKTYGEIAMMIRLEHDTRELFKSRMNK